MNNFDIAISLGSRCQTEYQIRRLYGDSGKRQFFDWIITPHSSIVKLIENDFAAFAELSNLSVARWDKDTFTTRYIREDKYGIMFVHEFLRTSSVKDIQPDVRSKYLHLAQRWRDTMLSGKRILFVRQDVSPSLWPQGSDGRAMTQEDARQLRSVIRDHYTKLDFTLLVIAPEEGRRLTQEDQIETAVVGLPPDGTWQGIDADWDRALARFAKTP